MGLLIKRSILGQAECRGGHWQPWTYETGWFQLAFGIRSQRIKGANRQWWTDDQVLFSGLFLPSVSLNHGCFWSSVVKTARLVCPGLLFSGDTDSVCGRTSLRVTGRARPSLESWQRPEMTLSVAWLCPANASLLIFDRSFFFLSLSKKRWAGGDELELRWKRVWSEEENILAVEILKH